MIVRCQKLDVTMIVRQKLDVTMIVCCSFSKLYVTMIVCCQELNAIVLCQYSMLPEAED